MALCVWLAGAVVVSPSLTGQPAAQGVSWERARESIGKYRTMLDSSGLVEVGSSMPPNVRRDDLQALCAGRQQAVTRARDSASAGLHSLIPGVDPMTADRRAVYERALGSIASFAGEAGTATQHFRNGRDALAAMLEEAPDLEGAYLRLELSLGVAFMRQGETSNCLVTPSADRCLFPVRPGGVHMHAAFAQSAAEHFEQYLKREPDDLGVRWLLNLAYMLQGRYPKDVPPRWRLDPDLFRSEAEMPRFVDVASHARLGQTGIAGGTIADDFNGDGRLDVFMTSVDYCAPARLYINTGDGTFDERSEASGLIGQLGGINAIQADYNNDGHLDIFVMRGGWEAAMRNSLLRNNGDGTFTDVTRESGLLDATQATHSVAWTDYDNDGLLDLFAAHELTPAQLFRNRGDGTFEDVTARARVGVTAFTKGVVAGDYDGNGIVNELDYNEWRRNFGSSIATADGNSDGVVNAADYVVWRNAFVKLNEAANSAGAAAVPEPLTWVIGSLAGMLPVVVRLRFGTL